MRSAIRRCGRVRWLAPAPAVGVGGRRRCRGGGAGRCGGRPCRAVPVRYFPAAGVADGRPMAASRPAHTSGRVCGPVVFGRDHVRIDCLSAADPVGPAIRRFPCEGADRGKELRHAGRDGAVSLSSPRTARPAYACPVSQIFRARGCRSSSCWHCPVRGHRVKWRPLRAVARDRFTRPGKARARVKPGQTCRSER